ncbi:MAG: ABC transporter permease, partial [Propionicimonas sp.]
MSTAGWRLARRVGIFAVSLLGASILIFVVTAALPGDVAQVLLGMDATPEAVARLRHQLGLDRPLPVQYLSWIGGILTGNFGVSHLSGDPVLALMLPRLAVTLWLVLFGVIGSLVIALPAGL